MAADGADAPTADAGPLQSMSPESRCFRFACTMPEIPARMLARCRLDDHQSSCGSSLAVADDIGGHGIGTRRSPSIIESARNRGPSEIMGRIPANNSSMPKLVTKLGATVGAYPECPDFRLATMAS